MSKKLSARKLESYKRAEKVARELRYPQLSDARHATAANYAKLFKLLDCWMRLTGDIVNRGQTTFIVLYFGYVQQAAPAERRLVSRETRSRL